MNQQPTANEQWTPTVITVETASTPGLLRYIRTASIRLSSGWPTRGIRPTRRIMPSTAAPGAMTTASPNVLSAMTPNMPQQMRRRFRHGRDLPIIAGQQDSQRGHDEQHVQPDHAVGKHRRHGLGAIASMFVVEHDGLDQVASDDAQRGQIE